MIIEHINHAFSPLLYIAVIFSIFTYIWDPLGYPSLRYDDGTYIGRAMHVLINKSSQEGTFYDFFMILDSTGLITGN